MSKQRSICLINDSFPPVIDGVANAVVNYGQNITANYGSASVVTPYYPDAKDEQFPFPVIRYPSADFTKLVGYRAGLPFSSEIVGQLENSHFDLIHSHCPIASTALARLLRERLSIPLVFTYHTKFDIDIANAIHSKHMQKAAIDLLVKNISACDEVWTVSRGAGENLRSLGFEGDYIVMPNGVDFPSGRVSDEAVANACEGLDLPEGVPVYLFVGRMMWYKGLRIILDALQKVKADGKDFRMVFIGKGTDKEDVQAYSTQLGLDDKVTFLPPIYDRDIIRAWYCRADLFLFPSTFDTNGLVVREAAACALPSLLVRGSCAAEDSTDGVNSFFMEENADSMAAVLEAIHGKFDVMKQVGENAQRDLYISWKDAVANACERYEVVLDNHKRGLYPIHEAPSDDAFRAAAEFLSDINRHQEHRQQVKQGILEDFRNLRMEAELNRAHLQDKMDHFMERFL